MTKLQEQFKLSLYGVAVGDAMGGVFQFNEREVTKDVTAENIFIQMDIFNDYLETYFHKQIKNGTWSDDAALTLATMDGLAILGHIPESVEEYRPIVQCFLDWYKDGAYTQDGYAWDIGGTTSMALDEYDLESEGFYLTGPTEGNTSGNGSLMRFAPVPFVLYKNYGVNALEKKENQEFVYNMSAITHASRQSKEYCLIYTVLMLAVLEGCKKEELMERAKELLEKSGAEYEKYARIFDEDFGKLSEEEIKSTGYIVHSLEAAVWSFLNTDNFSDCVALTISLGKDTDTIAAIAGSFAAVYYGEINEEWKNTLRSPELLEEGFMDFCKIML